MVTLLRSDQILRFLIEHKNKRQQNKFNVTEHSDGISINSIINSIMMLFT